MRKELVYICSPLSAKTQEEILKNSLKAKYYMNVVSELLGVRAVAPHAILPYYFDDNNAEERRLCVNFGLETLRISSAIVVCGKHISSGMAGEIALAQKLGLPLFFYYEENGNAVLTNKEGGTLWVCCKNFKKNLTF